LTAVTLLAERLRVEERQIINAFVERGLDASLLPPSSLSRSLTANEPVPSELMLDRGMATAEGAILATLLAANGATVVNRPATVRLLADRVSLIRHLVTAGLPVPPTSVCFGEATALNAIEQIGYPTVLKTVTVDPTFPSAFVEDRDIAEALLEHRVTLGGELATLAQQYIPSIRGRNVRAVVVGDEGPVAFDTRPTDGWRPDIGTPYTHLPDVDPALAEAAAETARRLGSGVYAIMMIETEQGPIISGAENLVDFRTLTEAGFDIAHGIVEHALSQHHARVESGNA
jgi:[lysine-biosynthesis-protein LysW]---L-2-aminoadipate ligase